MSKISDKTMMINMTAEKAAELSFQNRQKSQSLLIQRINDAIAQSISIGNYITTINLDSFFPNKEEINYILSYFEEKGFDVKFLDQYLKIRVSWEGKSPTTFKL